MKNRRLQFKVKDDFQNRVMLEIILVTFIFINSLVIVSFVALESIHDFYQFKFILSAALGTGEICGLAIIYYFSLRTSHRIAGPVFMLERGLMAFGEGDFTFRIKLRKEDFLQDSADLYNDTANDLGEKMSRLAATVETLRHLPDQTPAALQTIELLRQHLEEFKTSSNIAETQTFSPQQITGALANQ